MRRPRVLGQLIPAFFLIALVVLAILAWLLSDRYAHVARTQNVALLAASADSLERQLPADLENERRGEIQTLCERFGHTGPIRFTIISAAGAVIGDSEDNPARMGSEAERAEVKAALHGETGFDVRYNHVLRKPIVFFAKPILERGRIAGVVRTSLPLAVGPESMRVLYRTVALVVMCLALVATALHWWIIRRLTRPLEEIKRGAERLAHGDLSARLAIPDSAEIGSLAETINHMAAYLDDRIRTVMKQRHEQEAVFASMVEGVLALDNDERLIDLNGSAARLLGIREQDARGRSIQELVRNTELQTFVRQTLSAGEPVEADLTLRDVEDKLLQANGTVLRDGQGRAIGALIVFNDVTRLRRLENLRKEFVANVSHELKTPVTSIKGFVETLQDGALNNPEDAARFLDIIAKQVERLNAIIDDLLSLSKIEKEAERAEIVLLDIPINPIVASAVQLCEMKAKQKGVRLEFSGAENMRARANEALLEQAVVNLIDNAIKYSDAGSAVSIHTQRDAEGIRIHVRDDGCGIAAEHLPRLFERFYRVDKARSRKLGGTGLGLSIVKHIAQAHGGTVVVTSAPGRGSVFTINLPA